MGLMINARDCLRRMLSRCYALQNWSGNAFSEAQLLARIYANAIPDPSGNSVEHSLSELNALRPYIIVGQNFSVPMSLKRDAIGGSFGSFSPSGSLMVILDQVGQADSLSIKNIVVEGIYRIEPEQVMSKGDAQRAYIRVDWGYA